MGCTNPVSNSGKKTTPVDNSPLGVGADEQSCFCRIRQEPSKSSLGACRMNSSIRGMTAFKRDGASEAPSDGHSVGDASHGCYGRYAAGFSARPVCPSWRGGLADELSLEYVRFQVSGCRRPGWQWQPAWPHVRPQTGAHESIERACLR